MPPDKRGSQEIPDDRPVLPRPRVLHIEAVGRTSQILGAPYQELYWFEGRRTALPWPSTLWHFDGAGAVGSAVNDSPQALHAAAMAVDAARTALALHLPEELSKSRRAPTDSAGVMQEVLGAFQQVGAVLHNRALASRDPQAEEAYSLLVAAIRSNRAAVAWVGDCACFRLRSGECVVLHDEGAPDGGAGAEPGPFRTPLREPDAGHSASSGGDAAALHRCSAAVETGDVLVLASSGVRQYAHGPEEIARVVSESSCLEEACERLLVEARRRGSPSVDSVVMLGVALERTGLALRDPERSPFAFPLALQAVALPEGADPENPPGMDRLLRRLPEAAAEAPPEPESAEVPTVGVVPDPAGAPEVVAPTPRVAVVETPASVHEVADYPPMAKEAGGLRWWSVLGVLAFVAAAAAIGYGWRSWTAAGSSPSPQPAASEPLPEEPPAAIAPVPVAAPEYAVRVAPAQGGLSVSLSVGAPGSVEVILQEMHGEQVREAARLALPPGGSVLAGVPRSATGSALLQPGGFALRFERSPEGGLAWTESDAPGALPEGLAASLSEGKAQVRDVRGAAVLVVKVPEAPSPALPGVPGASGAPLPF